MRVVCTAGHVDHGKSTLVRALTGMEPDRFAEEQRRGLTIDLGFAWTQLGEHTVAFVDLPGHERFIANMLAGAGPVEIALFIVAADEGWKPQSQEHLDILHLLGVQHGIVALSKADLVDDATLAATTAAVRTQLAGSGLAGAPIVAVSAASGEGMDALRTALNELLNTAPAAENVNRPRLWVDRSFSIKGAGTVVTGTLTGGELHVGDELVLLPGARGARVRGLQSLEQELQSAQPGARVAVNLAGVDRDHLPERGDALARAGDWVECSTLEAWLQLLPGQTVGRKGAWHVHAGSARRSATIIPVAGSQLGKDGFVRVELDEPLALAAGDRFVLREAGRWLTVAGGIAVDVLPRLAVRGSARAARIVELHARLNALREDDRTALLGLHVRERAAADLRESAAAVGISVEAAREASSAQRLLPLATALADVGAVTTWTAAVQDALRRYHVVEPMQPWAPKDLALRAATAAGCPTELATSLLDAIVRLGRVIAEGPGLRDPGHVVALDDAQQAIREKLLAVLRADPFAPPRLRESMLASGASPALVAQLEREGALVRLDLTLAVPIETIAAAEAALRKAFESKPFTASDARQVWGTSRKYAVPLLEELDRRRITVRHGDHRTLT